MKMVCKKLNRYGGQKRAFGDEVEIPPRDVRLVTALGWFVPFQESKPPPAKAPATKKAAAPVSPVSPVSPAPAPAAEAAALAATSATPDPTAAPTAAPRADLATRGTYTRRDLTAEQRDD